MHSTDTLRTDTGQQAEELSARIVAELGREWRPRPGRHGHPDRFELHGPYGEQIEVISGPHRIEARGIHARVGRYFPSDFGVRPRTISFAADKTPAQMAAEIRRRLLPNVREVHEVVTARQAARDHRISLRRGFLEDAATLLPGLDWKRTTDYRGEPEYTDASTCAHGFHLTIDIPEYDADDVTLTIRGLTRDQALKVAVALAALRGAKEATAAGQVRPEERHRLAQRLWHKAPPGHLTPEPSQDAHQRGLLHPAGSLTTSLAHATDQLSQ